MEGGQQRHRFGVVITGEGGDACGGRGFLENFSIRMNIWYHIRRLSVALTAFAALVSCNGFVYEQEEDCTVYYRVKFRYDMNLKFADAFAHEVKSIRLCAFDMEDELVWETSEQGEALAARDYVMTLPLDPGKYRLVAWCGLGDGASFCLPDAEPARDPRDLHCRMNCVSVISPESSDGLKQPAYSDRDLQPLFHGMMEVELPDNHDGGEYIYEMSLTKDTNVFRVVLQHLSGEDIHPADFEFSIEDDNGWLAFDNSILREEPVVYRPWKVYSGAAGVEKGRAITSVQVAVAELTVNRLVMRDWTKYRQPMLTIRSASDGKLIASLPVIDYALLVKGAHHQQMDDQEYLDRADEYNMTFFLDRNDNWVSTVIQVNSWQVVLNDSGLD